MNPIDINKYKRHCVICNKEFVYTTNQKTCSTNCRKLKIKRYMQENYKSINLKRTILKLFKNTEEKLSIEEIVNRLNNKGA